MSIRLGFDMGIRNLAYCLMRHETARNETAPEGSWTVMAWDNVDLLEGGQSAQTAKRCSACTSPAKWIGPDERRWCNACATGVRRKKTATSTPEHPILPCTQTVKPLRELGLAGGWATKASKKDELIAAAKQRYLVPWKAGNAMDASLMTICNAMDTWLNSVLPTFASASLIRLENQPVMKGPTMKSVQMMLFTLLNHRLRKEHGWAGRIEFVHAGVKTKGKTTTAADATATEAYRDRKKTAEQEVVDHLTRTGAIGASWLTFFNGRSKKSDLADAFLMALRSDGAA